MDKPITDKEKTIQKMSDLLPKMDVKDVYVLYEIAQRLFVNSDDQSEREAE